MHRLTTLYSLGRTNTFRAASSELITGQGTNMQNFAKKIRHLFIPDEGKVFLQCDQSGAEALIVAYLCKPGKFRDLFLNNIKPHTYVALHLFKEEWKKHSPHLEIDNACCLTPKDLKAHEQWKEINDLIKSSDDWPAEKRFYYLAKQTCHSSNYGIRAPTFAMNVIEKSEGEVVLSKKQAEHFLNFYRTTFPEIPAWNNEIRETVTKTRILYNLFGHPREFTGAISESFYQEANAFIPQSTVGEITHVAFRDLQQHIESNKWEWDILANTHDSYLVQCEDDTNEINYCARTMSAFMNQELTSHRGEKFRMKSEIAVGHNWAPYHETKNPSGLREYKIGG